MASRWPSEIPNGLPIIQDVTNPMGAIAVAILLLVLGLVAGCFYYNLVVQAALHGKIDLRKVLMNWSWSSIQVISLALATNHPIYRDQHPFELCDNCDCFIWFAIGSICSFSIYRNTIVAGCSIDILCSWYIC